VSETARVGVTGAAGYIGSRVVTDLLESGHDVVPVDNYHDPKVDSFEDQRILDIDVRDRGALREAFGDVDTVMHLAAITGVEECEADPELAFDVNVTGTENIAWLCRERAIPLVFPASMAVIGDPLEFPIAADHPRRPLNHYGLTKTMSEEDIGWLAEDVFPALVFLKSNLYGHHEIGGQSIGKRTVINIFVERALAEEPLMVHEPGTQSRDFLHVKDVARAYGLALDHLLDAEAGCETVPLASGESMSVLEIAHLVQRIVEEEQGIEIPVEIVENPRAVEETDVDDFTVDTTSARGTLDFEAEHSIEESIRGMLR